MFPILKLFPCTVSPPQASFLLHFKPFPDSHFWRLFGAPGQKQTRRCNALKIRVLAPFCLSTVLSHRSLVLGRTLLFFFLLFSKVKFLHKCGHDCKNPVCDVLTKLTLDTAYCPGCRALEDDNDDNEHGTHARARARFGGLVVWWFCLVVLLFFFFFPCSVHISCQPCQHASWQHRLGDIEQPLKPSFTLCFVQVAALEQAR